MNEKTKINFIEKNEKFILWGIILVLFLHGAIILNYPPAKDNSMFLYMGQGILNGEVPYTDNFDMKPPGIYFIYAFIIMIFGNTIKGVYLFDLLWSLITILAVWKLAKYLFGRKVGLIACFFYGFLYFPCGNLWFYGQAEAFSNLLIVLGMYLFFLAEDKNKKPYFFFSGLFLGAASLIKYPLIAGLICLLLFAIFKNDKVVKIKERITVFFIFLSGLLILFVPVIFYFFLHDSLREMLYIVFIYTPKYAKSIKVLGAGFLGKTSYLVSEVFQFIAVFIAPVAVFSLFGIFKIFRKDFTGKEKGNMFFLKPNRKIVLFGWYVLCFLNVVIQGKFFAYHWVPFLVPVSVIGALGRVYFLKKFNEYKKICIIILFCTYIFSGVFFIRLSSFYGDNVKYLLGKISRKVYLDRFGIFAQKCDFSANSNEFLSHYIKKNTQRNDFIYLWGAHPEIYVLSGRRSASKFLMSHQLYCSWAPLQWRDDFLKELEEKSPRLFIVTRDDCFPQVSGVLKDSRQRLKDFKKIDSFLTDNYFLDKEIDMFSVYKRKDEKK